MFFKSFSQNAGLLKILFVHSDPITRNLKKITIYTLKNCPICQFLKGELEERKREYKEVKIEENEEIGNVLQQTFGTSTFPIFTIYHNGKATTFLRETDLDTTNGVIIFDINDINQIMNQYEI